MDDGGKILTVDAKLADIGLVRLLMLAVRMRTGSSAAIIFMAESCNDNEKTGVHVCP